MLRCNQQLKIKGAVPDWEVGFDRRTLLIYCFPPGKVWLLTGVEEAVTLWVLHQIVNIPSDLQAGCALLQARAAETVLWPLLGTNCCNHSRKFEKSGDFLCRYILMLQLLPEHKTEVAAALTPPCCLRFYVWHVIQKKKKNAPVKSFLTWELSYLKPCWVFFFVCFV